MEHKNNNERICTFRNKGILCKNRTRNSIFVTDTKNKTFRQFFTGLAKRSTLYARGESNPNRRNRNPLFYPLNYGRRTYLHFSNVPQKYNYSRLSPNFSAKKYHILETVK